MVATIDIQAIVATILVLLMFYLLINIRRKRLLLELLGGFPKKAPGRPGMATRARRAVRPKAVRPRARKRR